MLKGLNASILISPPPVMGGSFVMAFSCDEIVIMLLIGIRRVTISTVAYA